MLSQKEIETLLQKSKTAVRKGNDNDLLLIRNYVNSHLQRVDEELYNFLRQPQRYKIEVIEETTEYVSFSISKNKSVKQHTLHDSLFLMIPK